ncbi:hypothetical protein DFH06DRAFT_509280 [Mycena polygramma]|nr:hypothetical protein DFH06DRAFT_509280 [Mycena polygramma]
MPRSKTTLGILIYVTLWLVRCLIAAATPRFTFTSSVPQTCPGVILISIRIAIASRPPPHITSLSCDGHYQRPLAHAQPRLSFRGTSIVGISVSELGVSGIWTGVDFLGRSHWMSRVHTDGDSARDGSNSAVRLDRDKTTCDLSQAPRCVAGIRQVFVILVCRSPEAFWICQFNSGGRYRFVLQQNS